MPATSMRGRSSGAGGSAAAVLGLRLLAVALGVFFLSMGLNKLAWLTDSDILMQKLQMFLKTASPATRWYIETIATPGVPLFARIVPIAELSTGVALIVGFWTRLAAALAFLMVLNFHVATGDIFTRAFLLDGAGPPVLGALIALMIGGGKLPWTVSKQ